MRLAKILFACVLLLFDIFRHSGRGQTRSQIFGAFNFVRVAFFKHVLHATLFAHHIGTRLNGFTVGLLCYLAETTFGAEMHSTPAPRKIFITHIQYPLR